MIEHVAAILVRKITNGDFHNIERIKDPEGGGGQSYIDLPIGAGLTYEQMMDFLSLPSEPKTWPDKTVETKALGSLATGPLEFKNRQTNNRYRIASQNRHKQNRHPAWAPATGFPSASKPTSGANDSQIAALVQSLRIYIVKTHEGNYYAGFTNASQMPDTWPQNVGLELLFGADPDAYLPYDKAMDIDMSPLAVRIMRAWSDNHNILLYGPPGTGKTRAMREVWSYLESSVGKTLTIDPTNTSNPFGGHEVPLPFPAPIRREWTTFHQSYSYENFILGLRPETDGHGAMTLKSHSGLLLDVAMSVEPDLSPAPVITFKSGVLFIDEINRGNVSRIFGEFITFMDPEYRASSGNGALPVPLPGLGKDGEMTRHIVRLDGSSVQLPSPWYFPDNVFILASMNSVDRAVAPLDSALARRFSRIEVAPDMLELGRTLGIDIAELRKRASKATFVSEEPTIQDD